MSKFIKAIVASAAVLFAFSATTVHAKELKPTKGCGYEIFSAVEAASGNKVRLCLYSENGRNKVTIINGKTMTQGFDVSTIKYLHTEMRAMDRVAINIPVPNSRNTLVFGTLKSGKINRADMTLWQGRNATDAVPFKANTIKLHLDLGNGRTLEDYGIERRGQGANPVPANVLKAPSM